MEGSFKRAWCLLLILCALSFGLSLKEAEKAALENFRELRIEKLEFEKKRQERLERFGRFLPQINLEASFNLSRRQSFSFTLPPLPPQELVFQKESYPKFTLQLVQELYSLPSLREYEMSRLLESSQRYLIEEKELNLLFKVREAYIKALMAKSSVEIYRKHLQRVRSHLRDVEELYREGVVAYKDVLETRVKLYEVRERLTSAEANYRKALDYLSYLVGETVDGVEEIEIGEFEDISTRSEEELLRLLRGRPLLRYLRESLRVAEKSVDLAESYFYPQVVLSAFFQRTEESELFPKSRYLVSLALRWSLFSGLRRFRVLEASRISRRQALERYRDAEEKLRLELRSVLEDVRTAQAKLELAKEQLRSAQEHLRIAEEKFRAGLGTNTEVLDAQSYLTTAEETLRMNSYELLLTLFKLYEVTGYEER